jgi:hypothetical protein
MKKITLLFVLILGTVFMLNTAYSQPPTPFAAYTFEEDASDAMGNYDGTLEADAQISNDIQRGNVLSLTDSGYVSIPLELAAELESFSFTAWVNYGGTIAWAGLMGLGMNAVNVTPYWDFHIQGHDDELTHGKLSFYASAVDVWPGDGTAQQVIEYLLPVEEWTHIAFTFEVGVGGAVYANADPLTLEPWNSSNDHDVSPSTLSPEVFTIGRDAFNQGTLTNTLIDDFKFFNKTLTAAEVHADYTYVPSSIGDNVTLNNKHHITQNSPNPFNTETTIEFIIPESRNVKLSVYNIYGQEVAVLVDDFRNAGTYSVLFDGSAFGSGVYFYRLESNGHTSTRRMLLLK